MSALSTILPVARSTTVLVDDSPSFCTSVRVRPYACVHCPHCFWSQTPRPVDLMFNELTMYTYNRLVQSRPWNSHSTLLAYSTTSVTSKLSGLHRIFFNENSRATFQNISGWTMDIQPDPLNRHPSDGQPPPPPPPATHPQPNTGPATVLKTMHNICSPDPAPRRNSFGWRAMYR